VTHPTKVPTFDQETYVKAMAAWSEGGYGPEWSDWRLLAARAGIIFPPAGDASDSWSDPRPSQRAMVIRAIRETPRMLRWALSRPGVRTWGHVIEKLLEGRDAMGLEGDRREAAWFIEKRGEPPVPLAGVLDVVIDSIGGPR
jgi:hypothetical protein